MDILRQILERRTLCFSSYKNRKLKLKVKLWWVGARERKKTAFFVPFILFDGHFLTFVFYLSLQCTENTFQNRYFCISKKHYFMVPAFKIVKSLRCIPKLADCFREDLVRTYRFIFSLIAPTDWRDNIKRLFPEKLKE